MASGPITLWQIDGETMETMTDFIFLVSKSQWMVTVAMKFKKKKKKKNLFLGRKAMTNLDSILKSRDIILLRSI